MFVPTSTNAVEIDLSSLSLGERATLFLFSFINLTVKFLKRKCQVSGCSACFQYGADAPRLQINQMWYVRMLGDLSHEYASQFLLQEVGFRWYILKSVSRSSYCLHLWNPQLQTPFYSPLPKYRIESIWKFHKLEEKSANNLSLYIRVICIYIYEKKFSSWQLDDVKTEN